MKTHVILSLSVWEPVRRTGYVNPKTCQIYVVRNKYNFSKKMIFLCNLQLCNFWAAKIVISKTPWDYIPDYHSYFSDLNESIYGLFLYNLSTVLFVPMCFFFSFIHAIWSLTIGQHSLHLIDTSDWEWRKLYCTKRYLVHVPPLFKGRVTLPNRMNFRKIFKVGGAFSIQKLIL